MRPRLRRRARTTPCKGNPRGIASVTDLGADGIILSQPNPQHEDIAEHILRMYRAAGGDALVERIMAHKQRRGETRLTTVHHRETPRWLMEGRVDAGPVWATEIEHALRQGLPLEGVELGDALDQHRRVCYFACPVRAGRNPGPAAAFLVFLRSPEARPIFAGFGFTPAAS